MLVLIIEWNNVVNKNPCNSQNSESGLITELDLSDLDDCKIACLSHENCVGFFQKYSEKSLMTKCVLARSMNEGWNCNYTHVNSKWSNQSIL